MAKRRSKARRKQPDLLNLEGFIKHIIGTNEDGASCEIMRKKLWELLGMLRKTEGYQADLRKYRLKAAHSADPGPQCRLKG